MIYIAVQLIQFFSAGPPTGPRVTVVQEVLADLKTMFHLHLCQTVFIWFRENCVVVRDCCRKTHFHGIMTLFLKTRKSTWQKWLCCVKMSLTSDPLPLLRKYIRCREKRALVGGLLRDHRSCFLIVADTTPTQNTEHSHRTQNTHSETY